MYCTLVLCTGSFFKASDTTTGKTVPFGFRLRLAGKHSICRADGSRLALSDTKSNAM